MERLTFDGNFCDIAQCVGEYRMTSECADGPCTQRKVWERLKEYEDTGLEPEEIKGIINMLEFYKQHISPAQAAEFSEFGINRLRELAQADNVARCSLCKAPIYIKVKRNMRPILAPLTYEQELRDKLLDMTGEEYAELSGGFCPGCGKRR